MSTHLKRLLALLFVLLLLSMPIAASAAPASMQEGDENKNVKLLQEQLTKKGYYFWDITGFYGEKTKSAVRNFQTYNDLYVDGIAGPRTLEKMFGTTAYNNLFVNPPPAATPIPASVGGISTDPTDTYWQQARKAYPSALLLGDNSKAVSDLQTRLKTLGYFDHDATGYFGVITLQSVRAFQANNYSTVDCIVGPATLRKINSGNAIPKNGRSSSGTTSAASTSTATKATTSQPVAGASANGQLLIDTARQYIGKPYVYGAAGPNSFDCSGLVQYCIKQAFGVTVPRSSAQQGDNTNWPKISSVSDLQPGDLVFFSTRGLRIGHVGIYIGDGQMIHAPGTGKKVCVASMQTAYYSSRFVCGRRAV